MRPERDAEKAYWLVGHRDNASQDWQLVVVDVAASRNWTSSQIVDEFVSRYYTDGSKQVRVAPIKAPTSWDTFDRHVAFERRED